VGGELRAHDEQRHDASGHGLAREFPEDALGILGHATSSMGHDRGEDLAVGLRLSDRVFGPMGRRFVAATAIALEASYAMAAAAALTRGTRGAARAAILRVVGEVRFATVRRDPVAVSIWIIATRDLARTHDASWKCIRQ
jgi:hypothetical protein